VIIVGGKLLAKSFPILPSEAGPPFKTLALSEGCAEDQDNYSHPVDGLRAGAETKKNGA